MQWRKQLECRFEGEEYVHQFPIVPARLKEKFGQNKEGVRRSSNTK
jgi:hypothetical protein